MNKELHALARRLADLEQQKAEIASEVSDLKAEAKSQGFDPALLAKVVRVMLMDADKRKKLFEQAELFDTYLAGVGLLPDEPPVKAEPTRTLTNPRHVVKPSEVQKIADRAQARSADPPAPEQKAAADRVTLHASPPDEGFDIPPELDRRGGGTLRC